MEEIPWYAWIVIVAIISFTVIAATSAKNGIKAEVKKAEVKAKADYTEAVAEQTKALKDIETRLAAIEKTLSDIP